MSKNVYIASVVLLAGVILCSKNVCAGGVCAGFVPRPDQLFALERVYVNDSPYSIGVTVSAKGTLMFQPSIAADIRESDYAYANGIVGIGADLCELGSLRFSLNAEDFHSVLVAGDSSEHLVTAMSSAVSKDEADSMVSRTAALGILGLACLGLARMRRRAERAKKAGTSISKQVPLVVFRCHTNKAPNDEN